MLSVEIGATFGFLQEEHNYWAILCRRLLILQDKFFIGRSNQIGGKEWIGIYDSPDDVKPTWVIQGGSITTIQHDDERQVVILSAEPWTYSVMSKTNILVHICNAGGNRTIWGFMDKVRVVEIIRGPKINRSFSSTVGSKTFNGTLICIASRD